MQIIQADIIPVIRHFIQDFTQLPGRPPGVVQTHLPDMTMDFNPFDLQNLMGAVFAATLNGKYDQSITVEVLQEDPSHLTLSMQMEPVPAQQLKALESLADNLKASLLQNDKLEIVLPITNEAVFWSPDQVLQLFLRN